MRFFLTADERRALSDIWPMLQLSGTGFAISVLWGATGMGAAVALAATSAWLIARASQMPPVLFLQVAVTSVRLFGVSRAICRYIERLASHKVALDAMACLRTNTYRAIAKRDTATITSLRRGDILSRIGSDVDLVGDLVVKSIMPAAIALVVCLGSTIGICLLEIHAGIALGICLLFSALVGPALTIHAARKAEEAMQIARTSLLSNATTLVDCASELAVARRSDDVINAMSQAESDLKTTQDQAALPAAIARAVDTVAMLIAVIAGAYFGIQAVQAGTLSEVALAVVTLTPLAAFEATSTLAPAAVQLVRSAGAAKRIAALINAPLEQAQGTISRGSDCDNADYTINATDLEIAWPGGKTVASGINMTMAKGTKIAIVGQSGIGKSTLLYTLCGMLAPQSGSVTVHSKSNPAQAYPMSSLIRSEAAQIVSLTAEDAHIFATSVYENLRVATPELTRDQAKEALQRVGLGKWLESLPEGLDTQLGANATTISGGERRRLLIARSVCTPAAILAIDEPAEHLDAASADSLINDLFALADKDRGVVVVTHRLSPLSAADHVIILGRADNLTQVVAASTHAELLAHNEDYRWAMAQELGNN